MKLIYSIYRSNNEFSLYCKNALEWSVWNDKIVIDDYRFVLFNTYMRNAILMDNSEMKKPDEMDESLKELLFRYGFLVNADTDEKKCWEKQYVEGRSDMSFIDLTILLTENCQMRCLYCFEGTKVKKDINEKTIDGILTFLSRYTNVCTKLRVTWFGGEPLMAYKQLKSMSLKLMEFCKDNEIEYSADITTNGFALNHIRCNEIVEQLKVKRFIITLDGPESIHEQRRPLVSCKPSYKIIIRNIQSLIKLGAWVTIRMTIDKGNVGYVPEFLDSLATSPLKGCVGLAFCRTIDYNFTPTDIKKDIYNELEFVDVEWKLIQYAHKLGLWKYSFPHSAPLGGCLRFGDIVIGTEGELYKCLDTLGDKRWVSGQIEHFGNKEIDTPKWLEQWNNWSPFNNDKCKNCLLVPLCNGGCPHNVLFEDKKHGSNTGCPDWKGNYKRQIKSLIIEENGNIEKTI